MTRGLQVEVKCQDSQLLVEEKELTTPDTGPGFIAPGTGPGEELRTPGTRPGLTTIGRGLGVHYSR